MQQLEQSVLAELESSEMQHSSSAESDCLECCISLDSSLAESDCSDSCSSPDSSSAESDCLESGEMQHSKQSDSAELESGELQLSEQSDSTELKSGEMQQSKQPDSAEVQTGEAVEMQQSEQAVPAELKTGVWQQINSVILDADQLTTLLHFWSSMNVEAQGVVEPDLGTQMLGGNAFRVVTVDMPVMASVGRHDVIGSTNHTGEGSATENLPVVNELSMQCESQPITETHARSRKRKRQPGLWIANKRRCMRQAGEEYVSIQGKKMDARRVLPHKDNCKFKCTEKITEDNSHAQAHLPLAGRENM